MIKNRLLILLFFLISSQLFSQSTEKEIIELIENARVQWDIPGMAVGIIKDGEVFLSKGFGNKSIELNSDPIDGETLFAIASNTKAFIATAIGILVDEGKLSWNDKVSHILPYFEMHDPCLTEMVTVADLLCHRLGLGTFSGDVVWYKSERSEQEIIEKIPEIPIKYEFRNGYGYSNIMFIVAGEVIKAVSGKPWNEYIEEKIWTPLQMDRTIHSVKNLKNNFALPHKVKEGRNIAIDWAPWGSVGAAGGIISCTDDILNWIKLQLDHGLLGENQIFSRSVHDKIWTPHNVHIVNQYQKDRYAGRNYSGYGLGWGISDYRGYNLYSHGGGYDGMYSRTMIAPDASFGIIILTNTMKGISTPLSYELFDKLMGFEQGSWLLQGLQSQRSGIENRKNVLKNIAEKRKPNTKSTIQLENLYGEYSSPMFGYIQVTSTNNIIKLNFQDAPSLSASLSHWHYNTFQIDWDQEHAWFDFGTVQFLVDNNGSVTGLKFEVPNFDIFFEEIEAIKM